MSGHECKACGELMQFVGSIMSGKLECQNRPLEGYWAPTLTFEGHVVQMDYRTGRFVRGGDIVTFEYPRTKQERQT